MDSVNMLVSGIINREGKRFARVSFIRGRDIAEGIVPDGWITRKDFRKRRWQSWSAICGRTEERLWSRPGRSIR